MAYTYLDGSPVVHCTKCGNPDCPKVAREPYFAHCPATETNDDEEPETLREGNGWKS